MSAPSGSRLPKSARDRVREAIHWLETVESDARASIFYAVDTDVVNMYVAPDEHAKFSAIFRSESDVSGTLDADPARQLHEIERNLANYLGTFIVFSLSERPLILFPEHARELQRVMNAIFGKAQAQAARAHEEYGNAIKRFASEIGNLTALHREAKLDWLRTHLPEMLRFLLRQGPIGQMDRFLHALSRNRLVHIDRLVYEVDDSKRAFPIPTIDQADYAEDTYLPEVKKVAKAIGDSLTERTRRKQVLGSADGYSVAHLLWLNSRLEDSKAKVVLITGSSALRHVSANPPPHVSNFADVLRHPLGFLQHPAGSDVIRQTFGAAGLADWLRPLAYDDGEDDACDSAPNDLDPSLLEKWETMATMLSATGSLHLPNLTAEINRHLEQGDLGSLLEAIDVLFSGAAEAFMRWSGDLSLAIRFGKGASDLPPRNVPPLRFSEYATARKLAERILSFGSSQTIQATLSKDDAENLIVEDPTRYTAFLLYGLASASLKEWRFAVACAEHARVIAKRNREDRNGNREIWGDEAAYLLAVAIRLLARESSALERARELLRESRELQESSFSEDPRYVPDGRNEAELFSVDTTEVFFSQWKQQPTRLNMHQVVDHGFRLLISCQSTHYGADRNYIHEYIRQQIVCNLAQLLLICKFGFSSESKSVYERSSPIWDFHARQDEVRALFAQFKNHIDTIKQARSQASEPVPFVSKLVKASYLLGAKCFAPDIAGWDQTQERVRELRFELADCISEEARIAPIDEERFAFFEALHSRLF